MDQLLGGRRHEGPKVKRQLRDRQRWRSADNNVASLEPLSSAGEKESSKGSSEANVKSNTVSLKSTSQLTFDKVIMIVSSLHYRLSFWQCY